MAMTQRVYPGSKVVRVVDGDTVILDVDLGFGVWRKDQSFRLAGCNAREHSMPGGAEATANLLSIIPIGTQVTLTSIKPDKYGERYDARVVLAGGEDLAELLIQQGWAALWGGQGPKPIPDWPRRESDGPRHPSL